MNAVEALKAKKRMMFVKGDDFYFIAYNILLLLNELGCTSEAKPFKDYRKLAFLVDFVSDSRLVAMINDRKKAGIHLGQADKHDLAQAYARSAARRHIVMRLICAMDKRGLVSIQRGSQQEGFDLYLNADQMPKEFLDSDVYEAERQAIDGLRSYAPMLRTMKMSTMLGSIFTDSGVDAWHA